MNVKKFVLLLVIGVALGGLVGFVLLPVADDQLEVTKCNELLEYGYDVYLDEDCYLSTASGHIQVSNEFAFELVEIQKKARGYLE